MKKVFLLCVIVLVCIGISFAQNNGQGMNLQPGESIGQEMKEGGMYGQPMTQGYIPMAQGSGQMAVIPAEVQVPMDEQQNGQAQGTEGCSCECGKENQGQGVGQMGQTAQASQGQPMQQGYVPMGQEMKQGGEQGQPMEQGYMPMGKEMKESGQEQGMGQGQMQEESCDEHVKKLKDWIKQLEEYITENGLTLPEKPEEKTESEQTTEQEGTQTGEQPTQKFKGFFKKIFNFFQKSPSTGESSEQTGEEPTCTDSDNGKDYGTAGTVTMSGSAGSTAYVDYCLTTEQEGHAIGDLNEFYCNGNYAEHIIVSCATVNPGSVCETTSAGAACTSIPATTASTSDAAAVVTAEGTSGESSTDSTTLG